MKSKVYKLILLILVLSLAVTFGLAACSINIDNGNQDDENNGNGSTDGEGQQYPEDDIPMTGLILIQKNVAKFQIVTTSSAGSAAIREARDLITKLRSFGIDVPDVVSDSSAANVKDCEIIIGPDVRNRPEDCVISKYDIGAEGYQMKVSGDRVIIAGGTSELTKELLNKFIKENLGITAETVSRRNVSVPRTLSELVLTKYKIDSFTIAGNDISSYKLAYHSEDKIAYPTLTNDLHDRIFELTGQRLEFKLFSKLSPDEKYILVQCTDDAGEDGFRATVTDGNMVIECSIEKLFYDTFEEYANLAFTDNNSSGTISFDEGYLWSEKHIATICYEDFGAIGDGKTNDFRAIYNAHLRAEETGQKLVVKPRVYYIGKTWEDGVLEGTEIPLCIDTNFGEAKFIIDDKVDGIHEEGRRKSYIFTVLTSKKAISYNKGDTIRPITLLTDNPQIKAGTTSLPWLAEVLTQRGETEYMLRITDSGKKDFIRFGANANDGSNRTDVIIVDNLGNISAETPLIWDFDDITQILIMPTTDDPITIEGGYFETRACKVASGATVAYESYARGISVVRPNTTLKNIRHYVTGEGTKGYPYEAFISFRNTYNSTVRDTSLRGRVAYKRDAGVSMGSYDLQMNTSININFIGVNQDKFTVPQYSYTDMNGEAVNIASAEIKNTDIKDYKYWGLSASNGCKNLYFDNCVISRIDAHAGLWNLEIHNSTIGQYINVIGGGKVKITNTTRRTGNAFINLRQDYGATFNGDIELIDCHLDGTERWNSNNGSWAVNYRPSTSTSQKQLFVINSGMSTEATCTVDGKTIKMHNWDFGYKCYMPKNVVVKNFTIGSESQQDLYIYNSIGNSAFDSGANKYGGYRITESIKYTGGASLKAICPGTGSTKLLAIPITIN